MAEEKTSSTGKAAHGTEKGAADKGEDAARTMSHAATGTANRMANAGAKATRDVSQAVSNMADAGAQATRSVGQAAQGLAGAGANASRTMGQAAASVMTSSAGDMSKMFDGLRMPAMPDMDLMLGAYRRNLEALSAANRVALEGAQQIARRNMEIMQQTMGEMTDAMRGLTAAESPQDRAGKQAEMLKAAYERAVAHMKELADLIQRSNGEALDVLNQRFAEAMNEARTMVEKSRG